jgi:nucleoside-diphosphate-sugar epimerase
MSFLIVGANGNFSLQLQEMLQIDNPVIIDKNLYGEWENYNFDLISKIAKSSKEYGYKYLINTVGVISKNYSADFITYWNYLFPKHLYQICHELNLTLVTLGSIHENILEMCIDNPYLESKKELKQFLSKNNFKNSVHFQFHTWYGGHNVQPEMFLGQIINSLKNKTVFNMSDGKQIREYHHVFDDATCLLNNLKNNVSGIRAISHGERLTLEEIARGIFRYFDCEDLLYLGKIRPVQFDIRKERYLELEISKCEFRPTMKGLVKYVEKKV